LLVAIRWQHATRCRPTQPRFKAAKLPAIQPRARGGARACGPKVHEDILDYRRFQDRCNDLQLSATVRAEIQVVLESSLEKP
jgi:hypothetical protein